MFMFCLVSLWIMKCVCVRLSIGYLLLCIFCIWKCSSILTLTLSSWNYCNNYEWSFLFDFFFQVKFQINHIRYHFRYFYFMGNFFFLFLFIYLFIYLFIHFFFFFFFVMNKKINTKMLQNVCDILYIDIQITKWKCEKYGDLQMSFKRFVLFYHIP